MQVVQIITSSAQLIIKSRFPDWTYLCQRMQLNSTRMSLLSMEKVIDELQEKCFIFIIFATGIDDGELEGFESYAMYEEEEEDVEEEAHHIGIN